MKKGSTKRVAAALFLTIVFPVALRAQVYQVTTLNGLGGGAGGNSLNNRGQVLGFANDATNTISHAALWTAASATPFDLGSFGGASTNSATAFPVKNNRGLFVGISDTNEDNPLGEAFSCWPFYASGAPTRKICKGFRWEKGLMTPLPPFAGGYNSYATGANNRGQIVGWAENGVHDSSCNTAFQILQFRAALWEPNGEMRELPPLPGDSTSAATAINDKGQVVGISGACGVAVGDVSAAHAVIWENGVPTRIPDFGGHAWNTPTAINNDGVVVGFSLPAANDGTRFFLAFVWTKEAGTKLLDQIPGDVRSAAFGINEDGTIVGFSRTPAAVLRAVVWQDPDAEINNLNELSAPGSPYLLIAGDVNAGGEIAGFQGNGFAFLATPDGVTAANKSHASPSASRELPTNVRRFLMRFGIDD